MAVTLMMTACDPAEDRDVLSGAITAENLQISATPVVVDGKNSNRIELNSDGVACLSSWNYGNGITTSTNTIVELVLPGTNDIIFTGLNHDGTSITKTLTVEVETLIDVPAEWGILCGTGEKSWVWDDTQADAVWGNGGYLASVSPSWWKVKLSEIDDQAPGEGDGAEMVFSVKGSSLTKIKSDGTSEKGSFAFDMTAKKILVDGTVWAKGKLTTKNVAVLCGIQPNASGAPVYEYDILTLSDTKMVLSFPEPGDGGAAWFWVFKAK